MLKVQRGADQVIQKFHQKNSAFSTMNELTHAPFCCHHCALRIIAARWAKELRVELLKGTLTREHVTSPAPHSRDRDEGLLELVGCVLDSFLFFCCCQQSETRWRVYCSHLSMEHDKVDLRGEGHSRLSATLLNGGDDVQRLAALRPVTSSMVLNVQFTMQTHHSEFKYSS